MKRILASHVQAAIARAAQLKQALPTNSVRPVAGPVQVKPPMTVVQPHRAVAPHVQAACRALQAKTAIPTSGARPVAPHVQAAMATGVPMRKEVHSPQAQPGAFSVQASLAGAPLPAPRAQVARVSAVQPVLHRKRPAAGRVLQCYPGPPLDMMNLSTQVQYSQETGESFTLNSLPKEVTVYSGPLLKVNDYLWILYDPQDRQVMRGDGDSFSLGEFGTFARQGYGRYVLRHIHFSNDNVVGYSDFTFAVLDPSKTQDVPIGIDNTTIQEEVYKKYEKGEYYGMKLTHSLGTKSGNPVQDNIILSERVVVLSDDLTDESGETHSLGEDIFEVNGYEINDMIATPLNRSAISNKNLPLKSIEHQSFYYKDLGVLNGSWVYVCTITITVELTTDSVVVTTVNGQSVRQKWKAK